MARCCQSTVRRVNGRFERLDIYQPRRIRTGHDRQMSVRTRRNSQTQNPMEPNSLLNRRQFLQSTGKTAALIAATSGMAPAALSATAPSKRMLIRSPSEATASSARGASKPSCPPRAWCSSAPTPIASRGGAARAWGASSAVIAWSWCWSCWPRVPPWADIGRSVSGARPDFVAVTVPIGRRQSRIRREQFLIAPASVAIQGRPRAPHRMRSPGSTRAQRAACEDLWNFLLRNFLP